MEPAAFNIGPLRLRMAEHPDSPLFARLADLALSDKEGTRDVAGALALCEKGVGLYPEYASGHLVLGKCYQELGRMVEARAAFHRALELSPYNTVVQHLLVVLPDDETLVMGDVHALSTAITLGRPQSSVESSPLSPATADEVIRTSDTAPSLHEESTTTPDDIASSFSEESELVQELNSALEAETQTPDYEPFPTFEEYIDLHPASDPVMRLEEYLKGRSPIPPQGEEDASHARPQESEPALEARAVTEPVPDESHIDSTTEATDFESLALKLQQAGRIVPVPKAQTPSYASDGSQEDQASFNVSIVTPTMAEIYVAQKEYQAAIDAYRELINKQPAQAQTFRQRIEAIELLKGTS
ncbi:MAG TPA: tetratricopeptide repeat protein [Bacteroidota bacterium]|nr:tetratricopeptide repeat protein [Bacteroidota bacterium]